MIDLNLFAGAGGLAVGLNSAGFRQWRYYENDERACETLRRNVGSTRPTLNGTVIRGDVASVDWTIFAGRVRLLAGGVPCTPFSWAGKGNGHADPRNMFPTMLRAFRETEPEAALIENVHGIMRPGFRNYFDYILRQLECPTLRPIEGESWRSHHGRLIHEQKNPRFSGTYTVSTAVVDAADYGVPQNRKRVFLVAIRAGHERFRFPEQTHSRDRLMRELVNGAYWKRVDVPRPSRLRFRFLQRRGMLSLRPWRTVREAISGLPEPSRTIDLDDGFDHFLFRGARAYPPRHTGSRLDWPSKTIKAGVHWSPGGENMIRNSHGRPRYYTIREMARVQTFPDRHAFAGGTQADLIRQVGNAVPPRLGRIIGAALMDSTRG